MDYQPHAMFPVPSKEVWLSETQHVQDYTANSVIQCIELASDITAYFQWNTVEKQASLLNLLDSYIF